MAVSLPELEVLVTNNLSCASLVLKSNDSTSSRNSLVSSGVTLMQSLGLKVAWALFIGEVTAPPFSLTKAVAVLCHSALPASVSAFASWSSPDSLEPCLLRPLAQLAVAKIASFRTVSPAVLLSPLFSKQAMPGAVSALRVRPCPELTPTSQPWQFALDRSILADRTLQKALAIAAVNPDLSATEAHSLLEWSDQISFGASSVIPHDLAARAPDFTLATSLKTVPFALSGENMLHPTDPVVFVQQRSPLSASNPLQQPISSCLTHGANAGISG